MITRHEAIAEALVAHLRRELAGNVQRETELPEECPDEGVINLVFEAPRNIGDRLGSGQREISRTCSIEIVVCAATDAERRGKLEAVLVELGELLSGSAVAGLNVDYVNLGEPIEPDVIPMSGAASLRGATVPVELLYETSQNPMEVQI